MKLYWKFPVKGEKEDFQAWTLLTIRLKLTQRNFHL